MSLRTGGAASGMPSLPEVWQWEEQLVGFGTRYTGSSGHVAYVDWLAEQFSAIPGFSMRRRPAHLQPLAGPRLRPDGERSRDRGQVGPGPADLLLPLLRADDSRRGDR